MELAVTRWKVRIVAGTFAVWPSKVCAGLFHRVHMDILVRNIVVIAANLDKGKEDE